jgi:hypothetical protein
MSTLERHVEWTSPATLWDHFNGPTSAAQRRVFRTPAILRFASDAFMDEFLALMKSDPRAMSGLLAAPETWKAPAAAVAAPPKKDGLVGVLHAARTKVVRRLEARQLSVRTGSWNEAPPEKPLKLYQPAHQRYYLVASCLVCRTLGLPDRPLNTSVQERVTFVIRRLQPPSETSVNPDPATCTELAFVSGAWTTVATAASLVEGEEQYPLSPLAYEELDGRRRRLFNGLIPVAKRETLVGAPLSGSAGDGITTAPVDTRQMLLKSDVLGPWAGLEEVAKLAQASITKMPDVDADAMTEGAKNATIAQANRQIQTVAWYVLLDLSKWIEDHISTLWTAIDAQSAGGLDDPARNAYHLLASARFTSNGKTLAAALKEIRDFERTLENVKSIYRADTTAEWPSLLVPLVVATRTGATGLKETERRDLENALVAALPQGVVSAAAPRAIAQVSAMNFAAPWFTVRCVFERPNCSVLSPPVVSDPSASFQLAAFFDSDAPARPIRVEMPKDTTPAGLRKFDKNAAFVMSDVMCGQFSALKSLSFADLIFAVLPFPLHKDLNLNMRPCTQGSPEISAGIACSFSLPIITICALLMLMIIMKLLDMIFFWLPFFQICLPVPKFDAKGNS